ncbi:sulfurtransferase [Halomonas borealis]|uniref:sulfurtransferase n=1 Tax=Halomonas borealis TaxID=2508710 RepID=UPI0010A06B6F|nr:sulfurtransferase [Halomonas borealis]
MNRVLIEATELAAALEGDRPPQVLDCRARLGDPEAGARLWREGHVPGSRHLDMDRGLAAPARADGAGGRHPLPSHAAFTATLDRLGITPELPLVVYDDTGGQLAAARAWWMLACWAGHPEVRLLNGGLGAWQEAGGALPAGQEPALVPGGWCPDFHDDAWVEADALSSGHALALDARSAERFRGGPESVDPVVGHIPGARSRPSADNLTASGRFKSPEALDAELPKADPMIAYCGSGVTACHDILAYAIAGRPLPRLYVGSWSDWISDPERPIARGD